MAFTNSTGANLATEDAKEVELQERLKFLGVKVEEAENNLKEYIISKDAVDAAKQALQEEENRLSSLKVETEELLKINKSLERSAEDLQNKKNAKEVVEQEIKTLEDRVNFLSNELVKLEASFKARSNEINTSIKLLEDTHSVVSIKVNDKKKELLYITENIKVSTDKIESLLTEELQKNNVLKEKNLEILEKTKEINELNSSYESKKRIIDSLNSEIESKKVEADNIVNRAQEAAANKLAELEKREGDISDKEAWLNSKQSNLKAIKLSLEEFFGKKIHINFN